MGRRGSAPTVQPLLREQRCGPYPLRVALACSHALALYEITALGLRHVGYDTPIELFIPFLWACVEVVSTACLDGEMIVSFRWPLGLVAMVMQRTITEGSTIMMKAIDTYSVEQLREAIP